MKGKKDKTLAIELVDDLLDEVGPSKDAAKPPATPTRKDDPSDDVSDRYPFLGVRDGNEPADKSEAIDFELEIDNLSTQKPQEEPEDILVSPTIVTPSDKKVFKAETQATPKHLTFPQSKAANDPTNVLQDLRTSRDHTQVVPAGVERTSVGRFAVSPLGSQMESGHLAQTEYLRLAQQKILELEAVVEKLRADNEQLAAAGETVKRKFEEAEAEVRRLYDSRNHAAENLEEERDVMRAGLDTREKHISELKLKIDELEMRLSTSIRKIRVRERELENRLELVKLEGAALIRSKDEMILNLKRQVDQYELDLSHIKSRSQDTVKQLTNKQELVRRTVKALRLALSLLEGEDNSDGGKKQA